MVATPAPSHELDTDGLKIGSIQLENRLVAAPMAGVTDRPFRLLCRRLGAGMAVSEMLTSDKKLWHTPKSRLRMDHTDEPGPIAVQIAGGDAQMLAEAAAINAELGAQIIDINMGCPAKKVCRKAAGSALMSDPDLVSEILIAVVKAVGIPVTLKIRTGPAPEERNATSIARIAEDAGIQAIAIHGRTRAEKFLGQAEYDTIAEVVDEVSIPVLANGDVENAAKAVAVLKKTGAAGLMIGRAAQGNPWVFREIQHYMEAGTELPPPASEEVESVMLEHLQALYDLYGEETGVRVARKHLGWYLAGRPGGEEARQTLVRVTTPEEQLERVQTYFHTQNP